MVIIGNGSMVILCLNLLGWYLSKFSEVSGAELICFWYWSMVWARQVCFSTILLFNFLIVIEVVCYNTRIFYFYTSLVLSLSFFPWCSIISFAHIISFFKVLYSFVLIVFFVVFYDIFFFKFLLVSSLLISSFFISPYFLWIFIFYYTQAATSGDKEGNSIPVLKDFFLKYKTTNQWFYVFINGGMEMFLK